MAYLPAQKIAIAVATTFGEGSFDDQGNYKYSSHVELFAAIGTYLAPDDMPPSPVMPVPRGAAATRLRRATDVALDSPPGCNQLEDTLAEALLAWQSANARDLVSRQTSEAYQIPVVHFML